jgi:hypothetical protein
LFTWRTARYGFNPTDQYFVLADSWRILHGQVPHADFVTARPAGSPIFHMVDFLLAGGYSGPVFIVGTALSVLELFVAAIALVALVTRTPYGQWLGTPYRGFTLISIAACAALVDLHTFPASPWHTIDGIAFTAAGWYLLDRGVVSRSNGRIYTGLLLVGFSAVVKQSFAPAGLIALAIILWHPATRGERPPFRRWIGYSSALALLPAVYLAWVASAGGLKEAARELTASQAVWGEQLLQILQIHVLAHSKPAAALALAFGLAIVCSFWLSRRNPRSVTALMLRATACGLVVLQVILGRTLRLPDTGIDPATLSWWMLAGLILSKAAFTRRGWQAPLLILALGWITSLSWGYATPALMGGSLAATCLLLLWDDMRAALPRTSRRPVDPRVAIAAMSVISLFATAAVFTGVADVRDTHTYRDLSRNSLTADLGAIGSAGAGIRTSPNSFAYLSAIKQCVTRYPAHSTAILPDNAAVYPLLGLHDPFPIDWMYGPELVGHARKEILAAGAKLARQGGYLVLFETGDTAQIAFAPPARATLSTPIAGDTALDLLTAVRDELPGTPVACGPFVGVYAPRNLLAGP